MDLSRVPARERAFLRQAVNYLENPSLLIQLANQVGQPLELLARKVMPSEVKGIAETALRKLMTTAVATIPTSDLRQEADFHKAFTATGWTGGWHQLAAAGTGFAGGMFGLTGLAIELPISTGIMFRSIATIASQFGEDLNDPEVRLDCLSVFSQGGPSPADDALESTYYTVRLGLAELVRQSAQFLATTSAQGVAEALARGTAPYLMRYLAQIASRFGILVSEKIVAQGLPLIGAAGGAAINAAFADHFNKVARYHYGIRKLEREWGVEVVRSAYMAERDWLRATT